MCHPFDPRNAMPNLGTWAGTRLVRRRAWASSNPTVVAHGLERRILPLLKPARMRRVGCPTKSTSTSTATASSSAETTSTYVERSSLDRAVRGDHERWLGGGHR